MVTYYIKTFGNEDNGFTPEVVGYDKQQFYEVYKMLKDNGIPFKAWGQINQGMGEWQE